MKTETMVQGKCDICGDPVSPAKNQAQFNRNLGLHKWKAHNIRSTMYKAARRYRQNKKQRLLASSENGTPSNRLEGMLGKSSSRETTLNCDQPGCSYSTTCKTAAIALRTINRHKSMEHGIRGRNYQYKLNALKKRGKLNADGTPRRKYTRRTQSPMASVSMAQTSSVVPAHLAECPACHTRFYMAKGEQAPTQG